MTVLTYKDCVDCIDAIFAAAANDDGLPVCVAITDTHGDLIAFGRMDGAPMRSVALSRNKAYTAIYMDRDTDVFRDMIVKDGNELSWFTNPNLTALPGGVRIVLPLGCVGAIGISGRHADDDYILTKIGLEHMKATLKV